jgi:hypothetical protein
MILEIARQLQRKLGMNPDEIPSDPPMKWDVDARGLKQRKAMSDEEHDERRRKQAIHLEKIRKLRKEESRNEEMRQQEKDEQGMSRCNTHMAKEKNHWRMPVIFYSMRGEKMDEEKTTRFPLVRLSDDGKGRDMTIFTIHWGEYDSESQTWSAQIGVEWDEGLCANEEFTDEQRKNREDLVIGWKAWFGEDGRVDGFKDIVFTGPQYETISEMKTSIDSMGKKPDFLMPKHIVKPTAEQVAQAQASIGED